MLYTILFCILFITCVKGKQDEVCFAIDEDAGSIQDLYCTIGMNDRRVRDEDITASSSHTTRHEPFRARLDNQIDSDGNTGSWSSKHNRVGEWIQVDLHQPTRLTGIITQGRPKKYKQWVKTFKISYGNSPDQLHVMLDNHQSELIFEGNTDNYSYTVNKFPRSVVARYVRLLPQTWNNHISLRMEYLTC